MALTPQNNEAFFREVDEQVRQAQMVGFWRRYGRVAIGALVAVLLAFAGYLWWQNHRAHQAGLDSEALTGVLNDLGTGKKDGIKPKLDALAASPRDAYAAAARLTDAALALENGDAKAAAARYGAIAADNGVPAPFRDLALVRQTAVEFDTLPPAEVVRRLTPLAVAGSAWFGSAGEMVAVAQLKMNRPAEAGRMFAALARGETVPETLRRRAERVAAMLGAPLPPAVPAKD